MSAADILENVLGPERFGVLDVAVSGYISGIVEDWKSYEGDDYDGLRETVIDLLIDSNCVGSREEASEICDKLSLSGENSENSVGESGGVEEDNVNGVIRRINGPIHLGDMKFSESGGRHEVDRLIGREQKNTFVRKPDDFVGKDVLFEGNELAGKMGRTRKKALAKGEALAKAVEQYGVSATIKFERQRATGLRSDIHLHNFDITSPDGTVLVPNASITLMPSRRYGLVGRNGVGKTTFLRMLSHRDIMGIPDHVSLLHIEQEIESSPESVITTVLSCDVERTTLLNELKEVEKSEATDRLNEIYSRLEEIDSNAAEARAATILSGLGFTKDLQQNPTSTFSGGWRMRVSLACALFCEPDLLLLDEPTNMLDIESTVWLTEFLKSDYKQTLVVVSHDRDFLTAITTDIVHLHQKTVLQYTGNYEIFEQTREMKLKQQAKMHESQQRHRDHVQKFIDKFRFNAKRASLVQSRVKLLQRMKPIAAVVEDPSLEFDFPPPAGRLQPPVFTVEKAAVGYDPAKPVLSKLNLRFDLESRVAVVGANGSGKSTLLKMIMGDLEPFSGHVIRHQKLKVGYFAQHHVDSLDNDCTVMEFLSKKFQGTPEFEFRSSLARYGINSTMVNQNISTLSGGQKSRLVFATLALERPHFLLLDEPENHLDIDTVSILAQALNTFEGGVFLISHSQRLIQDTCTDVFVCENGTCSQFNGTFYQYKKKLLEERTSQTKK